MTDRVDRPNPPEDSDSGEKPVSQRFWPAQWVRSEDFWKDVSSRTLAGAIVVLLGFVVGKTTGVIGSDIGGAKFYEALIRVLVDVAVVLVGSTLALVASHRFVMKTRRRYEGPIVTVLQIVAWAVSVIAIALIVVNCDRIGSNFWQFAVGGGFLTTVPFF